MKWKETDNGEHNNAEKDDPYYEDDGYASFADKSVRSPAGFFDQPAVLKKWGIAAGVGLVVLFAAFLVSSLTQSGGSKRTAELAQRIDQLAMQLQKYENVDEKVTRIWEQAKSFESFKTRFDRSEASISLRMDHIAMSLDTLEKKTDQAMAEIGQLKKAAKRIRASRQTADAGTSASGRTHTVQAGDTLYSISRKYNLSVDALKSMNNLKTGAILHVGQTLKVSR